MKKGTVYFFTGLAGAGKTTLRDIKFRKGQEMGMSIFDRFTSRDTGKQKSNSLFSTPRRETSSTLDAAAKDIKDQYPEYGKVVDRFVSELKATCRNRYKASLEGTLQPMKAQACFLPVRRSDGSLCLPGSARERRGRYHSGRFHDGPAL